MTEKRILWVLVVAVAGWLIYLLAPILTPFVAAALLAYLGDPLVDRLQKMRMPRTVGVIFAFLFIFLGLGSLVILVVPLVRDQGAAFAAKLPQYVLWVESQILPRVIDFLGLELDGESMGLGQILREYGDRVAAVAGGALDTVARQGQALLTTVVNLFLIPVLTFYMLRDWDHFVARMGELVPPTLRVPA